MLSIPRLQAGAGAIHQIGEELARLRVFRPLIVSDRVLSSLGLVRSVRDALSPSMADAIYDDITENPLFENSDKGAAFYASEGCDGVIALGGGSVIDAAKYIALIATNGGKVADYAGRPPRILARCAPLIAVPTTAGTGSEASPDAGIHPVATAPSVGMSSLQIMPDAAILDPDLTLGLPKRLTAASGIDALSHCIEGYFSRRRETLSDTLALDGIRRVTRSLASAYSNGADTKARADMLVAAFEGGVSIGMGLGPAHAIAITCSDRGFPHGILSGIGLVCTLDLVARHVPDRAKNVADALGCELNDGLSSMLAARMRKLGLPATLLELGYPAGDSAEAGLEAHKSPFNFFAPYHPSADEYRILIERSLKGLIGGVS